MLEFPRFNEALRYTLEFYTIGRIKEYMFKFAGGLNYGYLDDWEDIIYTLHSRMEAEILQIIQTTNANTQVYFFEILLKDWLTDYRIASVNREAVYLEIDTYNEKTYQDFELRVEKRYEAFKNHPNFQKQHLEKYEENVPIISVFGEFIRPLQKKGKN